MSHSRRAARCCRNKRRWKDNRCAVLSWWPRVACNFLDDGKGAGNVHRMVATRGGASDYVAFVGSSSPAGERCAGQSPWLGTRRSHLPGDTLVVRKPDRLGRRRHATGRSGRCTAQAARPCLRCRCLRAAHGARGHSAQTLVEAMPGAFPGAFAERGCLRPVSIPGRARTPGIGWGWRYRSEGAQGGVGGLPENPGVRLHLACQRPQPTPSNPTATAPRTTGPTASYVNGFEYVCVMPQRPMKTKSCERWVRED